MERSSNAEIQRKNSSNFPRKKNEIKGRRNIRFQFHFGGFSFHISSVRVHLCIISFLLLFRSAAAACCGLVEMGVKQPRQATKQKQRRRDEELFKYT